MKEAVFPTPGDLQGLIMRGYGRLPAAAFVLLAIRTPEQARRWLSSLADQLTYADSARPRHATNLAISHHGLVRLGVDESVLEEFSNEFRSGMTTPHKRRLLGDEGDQAPEHWLWGGSESEPADILLLCYAADEPALARRLNHLLADLSGNGLEEVARLDTTALPEFREHFGFRDSIGQPYIAEFDRHGRATSDPVPLGEFVLGYQNGYGQLTPRPLVDRGLDPQDILPGDAGGSDRKDLGLNGSYLVFRQLEQDVAGFWNSMEELATAPGSLFSDPVQLAARMVGRWPSGTPLVLAPEHDDPTIADKDDFRYHATDARGLKCPLGAHIRRTHPRDSLEPEPGSDKSMEFSNRHRLLRRGRAYGQPFAPELSPATILDRLDRDDPPSEPRGLHFICINGNIGRQFEFVQHTWSNNPGFNGLREETDPLTGDRNAFGKPHNRFTVQHEPVRCQYRSLPRFVQTRGGGYFFMPGKRALRFLSSTPT